MWDGIDVASQIVKRNIEKGTRWWVKLDWRVCKRYLYLFREHIRRRDLPFRSCCLMIVVHTSALIRNERVCKWTIFKDCLCESWRFPIWLFVKLCPCDKYKTSHKGPGQIVSVSYNGLTGASTAVKMSAWNMQLPLDSRSTWTLRPWSVLGSLILSLCVRRLWHNSLIILTLWSFSHNGSICDVTESKRTPERLGFYWHIKETK